MFTFRNYVSSFFKSESEPNRLDPVIDQLILELGGHDGESDEYTQICENLKLLYEAKANEPKPSAVSPDTIAVIAGNIAGIAMILSYEKVNVVTSKALGFVLRTKT